MTNRWFHIAGITGILVVGLPLVFPLSSTAITCVRILGLALMMLSTTIFIVSNAIRHKALSTVSLLRREIKKLEAEPAIDELQPARALYLRSATTSLEIAEHKLSNKEWQIAIHCANQGLDSIRQFRVAA